MDEIGLAADKEGRAAKLLKFERIERSYYENIYYLPNLYKASFLLDEETSEFVALIDESEVYK